MENELGLECAKGKESLNKLFLSVHRKDQEKTDDRWEKKFGKTSAGREMARSQMGPDH